MTKTEWVEFRDPDGGYVLARPLDLVRCRVVASNLMEAGEILFKDARTSWKKAGEDLGPCTRLSPRDLGRASGEAEGAGLGGDPDAPDWGADEDVPGLLEGAGALEAHPDPGSLGGSLLLWDVEELLALSRLLGKEGEELHRSSLLGAESPAGRARESIRPRRVGKKKVKAA